MPQDSPLIMVNDVEYSYPNGTNALKDICLNINSGEFIGIMGPNGAGKSTLVKTLNGLIRPQKGSIFINEENAELKSIAELSKKVGIVFQNPDHQLFSNTVKEEIKFSLKSVFTNQELIERKVEKVLSKFYLKRYEGRSPLVLSGGEKKRLALASVVCRDPDILIFDEPTLGQDKKGVEFFTNLLNDELTKGKTIIIITHNIEFAYEYIPRILLIADGTIIGDGPTHEILQNRNLIKKSSLILPQIVRLKTSLKEIGLEVPEKISTQKEMVHYLSEHFKSNYYNDIGRNQ